ncbi:hypothetical protein ASE05_16065 [Mesorhizobium sp. Root172]|nr:hypothetical protein ASE05_16065 [Mesorhizobium sp. Root172]
MVKLPGARALHVQTKPVAEIVTGITDTLEDLVEALSVMMRSQEAWEALRERYERAVPRSEACRCWEA